MVISKKPRPERVSRVSRTAIYQRSDSMDFGVLYRKSQNVLPSVEVRDLVLKARTKNSLIFDYRLQTKGTTYYVLRITVYSL